MDNRIRFYSFLAILTFACSIVLADGDSRNPTPAEQAFSNSVLNTIAKAVSVGPDGWEKTGGSTQITDLKVVYSEVNEPLRLEYHAEWQDAKRRMDGKKQLSEELMKLAQKPGFTRAGLDELTKKIEPHDVNVRIDVLTNISSQGIGEKVVPAPAIAGGLVYQSQGTFRGGSSWHEGATYVFFGNSWKMSVGDATYIDFTPLKKAAASTVIQNMVVEIQADSNRSKQIIQKMDWEALKGLMK